MARRIIITLALAAAGIAITAMQAFAAVPTSFYHG